MTPLKSYREEMRILQRGLVPIAVLSFFANICLLALPLYLFQVYHRVLYSQSIETLLALFVIAAIVLITFGVLDAIRSNMLARAAARFESKLSGTIIAAELNQPSDPLRSTLTHVQRISATLASRATLALFDLPVMLVFLALIYVMHPLFGIVVSIGIAVLVGATLVGELVTRRYTVEGQKSEMASQRQLDNTYRQHELVRALGMYREAVQGWGDNKSDALRNSLSGLQLSNITNSFSKTARMLMQVVLIGFGAYLVIDGQIPAGMIFAVSIIGSRALAPIEAIAAGWKGLKNARLSHFALQQRLARVQMPNVATPLPRPKGTVELDSVIYFATGSSTRPLLKGVSAKFEAGASVAIVGPSGAGKSTLAKMLVGYLTPSRGKVKLDGQEMTAWDPVAKGIYVGYLPQSVEFLPGTIGQNIARFRRGDAAKHVVRAAKIAGVHALIMSFPKGYDTEIELDDFQPSGGQRQLIGLARAFYGDPAVVVLDEPNSNLDPDGERTLHQAIHRAKRMKITTIVVTQRLSLLQHVDKVVLLKDGLIERFVEPSAFIKSNVSKLKPRMLDKGDDGVIEQTAENATAGREE